MPTLPILIIAIGVLGALFVLYSAMAGPSPAKVQARRLDGLRERHSKSNEVAAQAQLKRILATRGGKMDSFAQKFIPNPALLRQRIERTGRAGPLRNM
jgi:tight adherence protein B